MPGLQITVGHLSMSDQIWQMSERNQILIGQNVRSNKIYCLMKKFCFIMLKEKLFFWAKKVGFTFVIQYNRLDRACLNFNSFLSLNWSSETDVDFSISLWLTPDDFTCQGENGPQSPKS